MLDDGQVSAHYNQLADEYDRLKAKSAYYHAALIDSLIEIVPPGGRVLEVGCATGDILAALKPVDGVGVDLSAPMIDRARQKYPQLTFRVADITRGPLDHTFDYVVSVNVMEHVPDLTAATRAMAAMLAPGGVMLNLTPHPAWASPFYVAERFNLKVPEGWHRWRSRRDLVQVGLDAGLVLRFFDRDFLVPRELPILSRLNRAGWARPLRSRLGVIQRVVFDAPK
ncbi:MAG: methyltransferase domain-containing protein [Candidatus Dormibacteraeota bacterium]|nr:methyltransferase domain-containing protein [Candidatus Dormibacteraeota bacterium]